MKMTRILQAVVLMILVGGAASCSSGREYHTAPQQARYSSRVSLILSPSPGFTMSRNPDGRFFHRSKEGFVYWQGYDNRFYLDKKQVKKAKHSNYEYREWKRFGRKYSKRGRY
ncbi:MAG TPA: hypothetical protein VF476_18675 [Chitinophagaceae bacterium]